MKEKILKYIRDWERKCYFDGLPDEGPQEISDMVPSYKRIAIAIMKNDVSLESLGFSRQPCEAYNNLKRIEIESRKKNNMEKENFTEGEAELLQLLCNGCNIALYREGQIRLRDKNHSPLRNVRKDLFERIRHRLVQKEGLFYISDEAKEKLPNTIKI